MNELDQNRNGRAIHLIQQSTYGTIRDLLGNAKLILRASMYSLNGSLNLQEAYGY